MPIHAREEGPVTILQLDLGRGNALIHGSIRAIEGALDAVERSPARAVVLTGTGRTFSVGLDLLALEGLDRQALGDFVDAFEGLFRRVFAFPLPIVAAIDGHAIAGGCILAMACDHRVISPGSHRIGVTEVALGIPFPAAAFEITRQATPRAARAQVLLEGRRFTPEEAVALGLVHRLAGERGPVCEAQEVAAAFSKGSREAVADTKADLCAPVLRRIDSSAAVRKERFLDRWFSAEAQARIEAVRAELRKRR